MLFGKKAKKKTGAYGFSKYDNEGRVTYSESKGSYGELVKHHYSYDNMGRRVYYAEYNNDVLTLEERKSYINNLTYVESIWYKENVYKTTIVNDMGRELMIKTINLNDNTSITKTFIPSTGTYDIKQSIEFFVPRIA